MPKFLQSVSLRAGDPIHFSIRPAERDAICLRCPLAECVGLESRECPIRVEQRRVWREKDARRKAAKPQETNQ
ncbi:MAG: hypothetical protein MOB07_16395 [Acidobacteria bacterium]|nr:hypothetical protein [Acidobacteriota bacterium]